MTLTYIPIVGIIADIETMQTSQGREFWRLAIAPEDPKGDTVRVTVFRALSPAIVRGACVVICARVECRKFVDLVAERIGIVAVSGSAQTGWTERKDGQRVPTPIPAQKPPQTATTQPEDGVPF